MHLLPTIITIAFLLPLFSEETKYTHTPTFRVAETPMTVLLTLAPLSQHQIDMLNPKAPAHYKQGFQEGYLRGARNRSQVIQRTILTIGPATGKYATYPEFADPVHKAQYKNGLIAGTSQFKADWERLKKFKARLEPAYKSPKSN